MRTLTLAGATAATGVALALLATPGTASAGIVSRAGAPAAGVDGAPAVSAAASLKRDSIKCGKGRGGDRKVNFSYKPSSYSTTIYFNNHCAKGKRIPATVKSWAWSSNGKIYMYRCMTTNGQTKGKKKFNTGKWKFMDIYGKSEHCK
ncbi:hypothetical protein GCM10009678_23410 [Actinomadura kijaniata]|uniref:Secreted protein n=1 Tax=Actinomadura namibiensis TaxID=182080 RepID=A0A7W3QL30_ACTNM|nr:hypothetical protein [Actinomadura namibiensis]MBA8951070.1 hypothetical protein [Actinomadura namibiensis]